MHVIVVFLSSEKFTYQLSIVIDLDIENIRLL